MISYIAIRDSLAIALADELGTYEYSNGGVTVAIAIETEANKSVEKATRTGLELVITPDSRRVVTQTHGSQLLLLYGRLTLRQWDSTKTTTAAIAIVLDALQEEFPGLTVSGVEIDLRSEKLDDRLEEFSLEFSQAFLLQ